MGWPGAGLVSGCLLGLACREEPVVTREAPIESSRPTPIAPSAPPLSPEQVRARKHAELAQRLESISNLAEAISLARPEMSDEEVAYRPQLPSRRGGYLLMKWGRTHFRWPELSQGREVDVASVLRDVDTRRGELVCVRGTFEHGVPWVLVDKRDAKITYRHRVWVTNLREQAPTGDCTVCGALVGRTIDQNHDDVDDIGLVVVGLVNPDDGKAPPR